MKVLLDKVNQVLTRKYDKLVIFNQLAGGHDLEARLFFAERGNKQQRGSSDSRATTDSHCDTKGVAMR